MKLIKWEVKVCRFPFHESLDSIEDFRWTQSYNDVARDVKHEWRHDARWRGNQLAMINGNGIWSVSNNSIFIMIRLSRNILLDFKLERSEVITNNQLVSPLLPCKTSHDWCINWPNIALMKSKYRIHRIYSHCPWIEIDINRKWFSCVAVCLRLECFPTPTAETWEREITGKLWMCGAFYWKRKSF